MEKSKIHNINNLRTLTKWLDTKFEGPFGIRFGIDPIIGLIPVVGDFFTSLFAFYILFVSYNSGVSFWVVIRMLINVVFENVVKVIPVFGWLFDFYWKANVKNLQILEAHHLNPSSAKKRSLIFVVAVATFLISVLVGLFYILFLLLTYIWAGLEILIQKIVHM